jgi:hypothetical protein
MSKKLNPYKMKNERELLKSDILTLRFDGPFSFIACTKPHKDPPKDGLINKWGSFGLFGDSPDFNKYDPNVSAEDFDPADEDFIYPTYRLLSEVIVQKFGVPIDFSNPGVLKKALKMGEGITVFPDHNFESVSNSLGVVVKTYWQESYKVGDTVVPAGINAIMKLDAKSNPRIARGINMVPPSIHSSSVTVKFRKEKSHPSMEDNDFWDKLGSYDANGELVRFIVSEVDMFAELSLVAQGADPFAQKIQDNKIVNPTKAKKLYSFSWEDKGVTVNYRNFNLFKESDSINLNLKSDAMDYLKLLTDLGISEETLSDEQKLKDFYGSLEGSNTQLLALQEIAPDLSPESLQSLLDSQIPEGSSVMDNETLTLLDSLKELGGLDKVKALMADGETYLNQVRLNAVNALKLVSGDSVDETILENINRADLKTALSFEAHYNALVEKNIPLTCKDCGSENVTRASHSKDGKKEKKGLTTDFDAAAKDTAKRLRRKPSSLHQ